jgi:hypothetical protein
MSDNGKQPEAVREESQPVLPAVRPQRPTAIIPRTLQQAMELAMVVHRSGLAPRALGTPDRIAYAVLYGAELGLPPMASLKSVSIINGVPSLFGDAPLALVRASGQLEYIKETLERDPGGMPFKAVCITKRRGAPEEAVTVYTRKDAEIAGLWGAKEGPWRQHPGRMLQLRARTFNLRDNYGDILTGLANLPDADAAEMAVIDGGGVEFADPPPEPRRGDQTKTETIENA